MSANMFAAERLSKYIKIWPRRIVEIAEIFFNSTSDPR